MGLTTQTASTTNGSSSTPPKGSIGDQIKAKFEETKAQIAADKAKDAQEAKDAAANADKATDEKEENPTSPADADSKAKEGEGFWAKTKRKAKSVWEDLKNGGAGGIIGGIVGLFGAYLAGNFFGGSGSWIGMFLMVVLAIPLSIIGAEKGRAWLGGDADKKPAEKSDTQLAKSKAVEAPGREGERETRVETSATSITTQTLSHQEILAALEKIKNGATPDKVRVIKDPGKPVQLATVAVGDVNLTGVIPTSTLEKLSYDPETRAPTGIAFKIVNENKITITRA